MTNWIRSLTIVGLLGLFLPNARANAQSVHEVAAEVDRLIDEQTQPSPNKACDDETYLRRIFLDITGNIKENSS